MSRAGLRTDAVILACAISAGIHGALAPEHFRETFAAGAGFVASAVVLAALAAMLTREASQGAFAAAALVFAGLIGAYALAVTIGLPLFHPEPEPVDGLALFTKAVEAAGLAAAAAGIRRPAIHVEPKGHTT